MRGSRRSLGAVPITGYSRYVTVAGGALMGMKRGTSMGGMEKSPRRRKIERNRRKKQDFQWAAKAGPVTTVQMVRGPDGEWMRPTG